MSHPEATTIRHGSATQGASRMRFLVGFGVMWATVYVIGAAGETGIEYGPLAAVAVLVVALVIDWRPDSPPSRRRLSTAALALGLGRPAGSALVAAVSASTAVVVAVLVYAKVADLQLHLRAHWPWLLVCLLAYHGFAEELAWRGYAYGHLRRTRTFRRAVLATMPLLAVTHIPIILESGPVVGLAAIAVAALTCLPLSHLYELAGASIWPGALLHAAIDSFKLVDTPADPGFALAVAGAAAVLPFLVFAWHRPPTCPDPTVRYAGTRT